MAQLFIAILLFIFGVAMLLRGRAPGSQDAADAGGRGKRRWRLLILRQVSGVAAILLALVTLASTSFVFIDARAVGHLKRIYASQDLPKGRIIAVDGQKGPQARVLGPGFHFVPLLQILYDVEQFGVVTVPDGSYGELTALDGQAMPDGMFIAPAFDPEVTEQMLDAEYFLGNGGIRGPQETVLKPGSYRLNRYLWKVEVEQRPATVIPAGFVGVVKSNVRRPGVDCPNVADLAGVDTRNLRAPLVPKDCIGVWRSPLYPGAFYLNLRAYDVTLVDTRAQAWIYKGGYTRRRIDLQIDQDGRIKQRESSENIATPESAADQAVFIKLEGWDIPQELRVVVQVTPENAPIVVASVGDLAAIENRIITPSIRSVVRNIAGHSITVAEIDADGTQRETVRPVTVLDLIENRAAIEKLIEDEIKTEGRKAGIDIRLREQLAQQLARAFTQERDAQEKRIETEKARAAANEQPRLVRADIDVQVSERKMASRRNEGAAERNFLEELAEGQKAQVSVLGQDRVLMLEAMKQVLATLREKPELVALVERLVPNTVVTGDGGMGLAGAAAIIGNALTPRPRPSAGRLETADKPAQ
jgi:hypothetical protein